MIELLFSLKNNWIDQQEYLFLLIDAVLFLLFLIAVLYLFIFAAYSKKRLSILILKQIRNTDMSYCSQPIWKMM